MCSITDLPMAIFTAHYITALTLAQPAFTAPSSCTEGWKEKEKQLHPMNPSVNIASYKPKQQGDPTLEITPGREG